MSFDDIVGDLLELQSEVFMIPSSADINQYAIAEKIEPKTLLLVTRTFGGTIKVFEFYINGMLFVSVECDDLKLKKVSAIL